MAEISLTQRKVALVDEGDYEWLAAFKWTAMLGPRKKRWLAARGVTVAPQCRRLVYMAREIMGLAYGDPREAHHLNHDTLDNRRENLRVVTGQANRRHQLSRGGSSSFVGVTWDGARGRWRAQIQIDGRVVNLGRYSTEQEAARARDDYVVANGTGHALNMGIRDGSGTGY